MQAVRRRQRRCRAKRRKIRDEAECQVLPGQDLPKFADHAGVQHHVLSDDVNDYCRDASGGKITAKDCRT